jgi:hypothetical protein
MAGRGLVLAEPFQDGPFGQLGHGAVGLRMIELEQQVSGSVEPAPPEVLQPCPEPADPILVDLGGDPVKLVFHPVQPGQHLGPDIIEHLGQQLASQEPCNVHRGTSVPPDQAGIPGRSPPWHGLPPVPDCLVRSGHDGP